MIILFYSDKNYEYQAQNLLNSFKLTNKADLYTFLYYTIGFDSDIEFPNLIKKRWEFDEKKPTFDFYKPDICIDALKTYDNVCYLDTDIVISKRFVVKQISNHKPYPMCSRGPLDFPYTYRIDANGIKEDFNERKLMTYYGVQNRSMDYVMACFMIINPNCVDFLKEYSAICKNEYLIEEHYRYYPFRDETALNVCFWKRGINDHLNYRFVNTHKFSTIKMVEENDNILNTTIDNNMYEYCKNSGHVWFYHGTKIPEENNLIFEYYGSRNL